MIRPVIIDSGVANLASVAGAFGALGAPAEITSDPAVVANATHLILPGVGSFDAGMVSLRRSSIDRTLRESVFEGRPLLAICLGMQLLTDGSDEAPAVKGLGLIPGRCTPLPVTSRVPHLGWNRVVPAGGAGYVDAGNAAFANSYCLRTAPPGWRTTWTTHGVDFVAAVERDRLLACQFHPELSGEYGVELLRRWLEQRSGPIHETSPWTAPGAAPRIAPCLDVRDGRVVKGVNFQGLRDVGDPATCAARYQREGADELVMLDIAATPNNAGTRLDAVRRVRAQLQIPLTVGGGVRTVEDAARLLAAGADKVTVNTAAVHDPTLLTRLAAAFGRQCIVLAIDARVLNEGWETLTHGGREGTGRDAVDWAETGAQCGAGELLITSWDRDGTGAGCDLDLLAQVRERVGIPIVASGGIGGRTDVVAAFHAGADAVLVASILHDQRDTVHGVKIFAAEHGIGVRR